MAAKYFSLAILALLGFVEVQAAFARAGSGVVRIELTKHFQAHHEI
jgi:hypothetical protein